jgi:hypothetical protein
VMFKIGYQLPVTSFQLPVLDARSAADSASLVVGRSRSSRSGARQARHRHKGRRLEGRNVGSAH